IADMGGAGILIDNNQDSTINLTNTATVDAGGNPIDNGIEINTGAGDAITITGNSATPTSNTTINFSGTVGVTATGGVRGINIATNDADTSINFSNLDATAQNGNTVDIAGGGTVTLSSIATTDPTRTIENTGTGSALVNVGDLVVADNNAAITVNSNIENSGGGNAAAISMRSNNNVTFNGNVTDTNSQGIDIRNNTAGTFSFLGETRLTSVGGDNALTMFENEGASVSFTDLQASAVNGNTVDVTGGGTLTITDPQMTNSIDNTGAGTAVRIEGNANGDAIVSIGAPVDNMGGGRSVHILNRTSNDVTFNGTINDLGNGLLVSMNTGGTIDFTQSVTTNVGGANRGVDLDTNTGTTLMFNGIDITTTGTGTGFRAVGGGTLVVASPNTPGDNSITTDDGTALDLQGMTIDTAGVTIDVLNVNGTTAPMGINLQNLDGAGQVAIGGTDTGDGGTIQSTGTAINVDNVLNVSMTNMTVTNNVGGNSGNGVVVTNQAAGSMASFNDLNISTQDGDAVNINTNTDGVITFSTLTASTGGAGDGIDLNNADGSAVAITINDVTVNANGTGRGFAATGGGTITVGGTANTIDSVGAVAFEANNTQNLTASNVTIDNTTQQGVRVTGLNEATDAVTLTNFDVTTTTAIAVGVDNNTNGAININSLTAESDSGNTVDLNANTGATININGMAATSTGTGDVFTAAAGGTLNMTGTNNMTAESGRGAILDGVEIGTSNAVLNSVIVNAGAAQGISIRDTTGTGRIIVNGGMLTSAGVAVRIINGNDVSLNNLQIDNSGTAGDGILADNMAGDSLALQNVVIETSTGRGVDVEGGIFLAGGANTITTTTGVGLDIRSATIGGSGASFNSVNVNGASRGIALFELQGGQVTVGSNATASTLNTTSDAIVVRNTANVNINNVDMSSTGGRGLLVINNDGNDFDLSLNDLTVTNSTAAIEAIHTGAGNFTFSTTASDFDDRVIIDADGAGDVNITFNDSFVDTTGADVAFTLDLGNNVTDATVQIRRSEFTSDAAAAIDFDSNSAAVKSIDFELSNSLATNNSASASVDIDVFGPTVMNTAVNDSVFTNTGAGDNFNLAAVDPTTIINLSMDRNVTNGGTDSVVLRELNGSDFNIVDRDNIVTRNPGVGNFIFFNGVVNDINSFDDIPALP
ncbi:MAG: hypothetical protein MI725_16505, partial [Pirellulales bacterium]|nr:hypothetical protein [Pirellulales bacterium]